jgi:acetyltransferase-like isoleucine patch superfamily enzyme
MGKMRSIGRVNLLSFLAGTPFMNLLTRLQGGTIGRNCCLFPTGGDPYMPEPDLVTMGQNCVVDKASVVCHLNSGGHFQLERITMENDVTLRTRSRIQQGVVMEQGSMLLEKSLVLTGEVMDARSCWHGSPAVRAFNYPALPETA